MQSASSFVNHMEKERWVVSAKRADFVEISRKFGIDPVTARLIRNRDVEGDEAIRRYLFGGLSELSNWRLMKDVEKAAGILKEAITQEKKIRIIGDYDIDGVMSSYILQRGISRVGGRVDVVIPDRIQDGYGINESLIARASEDGVDMIVTCDNGIAASEQIRTAKELGMTVIVTDHHEVPFEEVGGERREVLPPADAVINPKQKACPYPFKKLCGAAVAAQLIFGLYDSFGVDEKENEAFLEFEAIATIGDVMDLEGDNRIIVKEGLKRLHQTDNMGLTALIAANGLEPDQVTPYHIGFVIGPCLNASGRLDTAKRSLKLLCAQTWNEAVTLADELKALNEERKSMTEQGVEEAVALVESGAYGNDRVLVIYLPDCHESLAGIIAGRLRERYHRPTFVLTRTKEGVKGSGRSIEAYSMYEELVKVKEVLGKFGGHPMAAGVSMAADQEGAFRESLNRVCSLTAEDLMEKVVIDVAMPISYITKELVQEFSVLEPFGKGNTKPVFAQKNLRPIQCRILGKNRNVVKMKVMDQEGCAVEAVYFGDSEAFMRLVKEKGMIDIVYYPDINVWQGRETLQIVITHIQ